MSEAERVVVVAGAQGVIGRNAAVHFSKQAGTTVYGLSRRPVDLPGVRGVAVDLLDPADARAKLGGLSDATHLVFAAYVEKATAAEKSAVNSALLENTLDGLEAAAPGLRHVTLYQGGKAYGADLGPFKTPAREDDPRLMPPNFYYDQEDILKRRREAWHYTVLRPEAVCGFALGNPMNLAMVIAVYATLSKELGLPLRFPGPLGAYRALYQVTSADVLARATDWAGTTPAAREEVYNITNGDSFRWEHLWPRIARMFDMETAPPVPLKLAEYMADKGPLWDAIGARYGLASIPYEQAAAWGFGDFIFHSEFDNITSTIKARRHGFHDCIDTEEMFLEFFDQLREARVIPPRAARA
ncbi:SDR family oxidoreductase [Paludisphaera mucosa]|uniref:SDR family oxidoreductase n=1 Tax=Paludisphaera mucosa TaxID=3030827 RepID=A0ABT6FJ36_9BACT|nr:SDR family oxidoreductase [Paludisphaera mucosa]MDG3007562.1 SDR family oxidoreductase [Paludisphaera mucosa]